MFREQEMPGAEWGFINTKVKDILTKFFYNEIRHCSMTLPITVKV